MRALIAIVLATAALSSSSCSPKPTAEDARRLGQLKQQYGNRYRFDLAEDTYVEATNKVDATVSKAEAIAIYKAFWFTGDAERVTQITST